MSGASGARKGMVFPLKMERRRGSLVLRSEATSQSSIGRSGTVVDGGGMGEGFRLREEGTRCKLRKQAGRRAGGSFLFWRGGVRGNLYATAYKCK